MTGRTSIWHCLAIKKHRLPVWIRDLVSAERSGLRSKAMQTTPASVPLQCPASKLMEFKVLCHCGHCQKASGSVFSTNIIVDAARFRVMGTPKSYSTTADSGYAVTFWFCPDCGSPLWRDGEMVPDVRIIRAGTLENRRKRDDAKPAEELYTATRVDWLCAVPGVTQLTRMF